MDAASPNPASEKRAALLARLVQSRWLIAVVALLVLALLLGGMITLLAAAILVGAVAVLAVALPPGASARGAGDRPPAASGTSMDSGIRAFARALPDPCFVLDRRAVVRYVNERAASAFSIRAGELLTFRLRNPDVVAAFDRVAHGGPPERVEFTERIPTERWLAAWFADLGAPGRPPGEFIALIIDDLTEMRRTDRIRVDFVANASHELRTPLASLAGFIDTLRGPARDDTEARARFLGIMHEQAERMSRLVDDLLSLSRIEMKAHVRPSGRVDLASTIRHVADSLEPLVRDLGVEIDMHLPVEPVDVTGDRDELIQVFENLIENACKYGQSGKRVVVTLTAAPGGAKVSVKDFGPGIPEEHLPRLTERFYRVDLEASRRHRGTGLGLAIVKHILARHQARMTVESRLGEGAEFTVTFPPDSGGKSQER